MKRLFSIGFGLLMLSGTTIVQADETPTLVSTEAQNRKILIEEYTGVGCTWCPLGHLAANQVVAENPGQAFVINIHQGSLAEGFTPDLTTEWGNALNKPIGSNSYPSGTISRHMFAGNDKLAVNYEQWSTIAPEILALPSYVNVGAKATIDWATRKILVEVEVYYTGQPGVTSNAINVALLQDNIIGYQNGMAKNPAQIVGNQYKHMHALRDLLTGQWGESITDLAQGKLIKKTYAKELPEAVKDIDLTLEDLSVIVFVAEGHTEILNACKAEMVHLNAPVHVVRLWHAEQTVYPACTPEGTARLHIANIFGNEGVESYTIEATTDAGTQTFDFEPADFAVGTDEYIEIGPFPATLNLRDTVTLRLTKINGEAYTVEEGQTVSAPFVKWANYVSNPVLNLVQDQFGTDITWTLTRDKETLQTGGPYRDLQEEGTRANTVALSNATTGGCYTLTVFDKNGDGINNIRGEGYIEIQDGNGHVAIHMDGKYDSSVQIFFQVTGVANEAAAEAAYALSVNPNPVSAMDAELDFEMNRAETLSIAIYNLSGLRLGETLRYRGEAGQHRLTLPTASLPAGIYLVMVNGEDGRRAACKLVVR